MRRRQDLKGQPFVLAALDRGRMRITAVCPDVQRQGFRVGMAVADVRALIPQLQVVADLPGRAAKLLTALGHWATRFTPCVATHIPDGLCLDATGCTHLWKGETNYLEDIRKALALLGYTTHIAIAGTVGAAWALARYGKHPLSVIAPGEEKRALGPLPPAALRLEAAVVDRLQKLGLYTIGHFIDMGSAILRRRFGAGLPERIDQALGIKNEPLLPMQAVTPFQERLPCLEPVTTRYGIEMALQQLIELLCKRLAKEGKGIRKAIFKAWRIDHNLQAITIGTHLPSQQPAHLVKLFELKIDQLEPALGFEMFAIEAPQVEDIITLQNGFWHQKGLGNNRLAQLLDQLTGKLGPGIVHRYLPDEHYWPERSFREAASLHEQPATRWTDRPRPIRLLNNPEPVQVAAPIPDYPPMHFRYKGILHTIKKADGPERIEAEWWIREGEHRDYYIVENEHGERFWLFRLGHYDGTKPHRWYLHGFFA